MSASTYTQTHSYRMINSWAFLQSTDCFHFFDPFVVYLPIFFAATFIRWIHASCMQLFIFIWYFYFHSSFISICTTHGAVHCAVCSKIRKRFWYLQCTSKDDWVEHNWRKHLCGSNIFPQLFKCFAWLGFVGKSRWSSFNLVVRFSLNFFTLPHAFYLFHQKVSTRKSNGFSPFSLFFSIVCTWQIHFLIEFVCIEFP